MQERECYSYEFGLKRFPSHYLELFIFGCLAFPRLLLPHLPLYFLFRSISSHSPCTTYFYLQYRLSSKRALTLFPLLFVFLIFLPGDWS